MTNGPWLSSPVLKPDLCLTPSMGRPGRQPWPSLTGLSPLSCLLSLGYDIFPLSDSYFEKGSTAVPTGMCTC